MLVVVQLGDKNTCKDVRNHSARQQARQSSSLTIPRFIREILLFPRRNDCDLGMRYYISWSMFIWGRSPADREAVVGETLVAHFRPRYGQFDIRRA